MIMSKPYNVFHLLLPSGWLHLERKMNFSNCKENFFEGISSHPETNQVSGFW